MFIFAVLLGIYSYGIFFLGILGYLYKEVIACFTIVFVCLSIYLKRNDLMKLRKIDKVDNKLFLLLFIIFFTQVAVNFIGVLGPELAFDALWYHLTIPKIYLSNHAVFFIPGGLLYYSAMPKLAEMFYVVGLALGNEITVKVIHFLFGLLTCLALYKLQRKFFNQFISLVGVLIFYANLVVSWESITAYIDLIRTFFELMGLWGFVNWWETQKRKWLSLSAVMIGFAIATKLLAIGSFAIFLSLIILLGIKKKRWIRGVRDGGTYTTIALLVPLPWFIFSFVNTGNPIYPLFSSVSGDLNQKIFTWGMINPLNFLQTSWHIFTQAADPISPVYLIFLPCLLMFFKKFSKYHLLYYYTALSFLLWYMTSKIEGSRLLLPCLTAFSILIAALINEMWQNRKYQKFLGNFFIALVIFVSLISISYRFVANKKYVPVILGKETKTRFLSEHLNFEFSDFYDTDGYFKKTIRPTDMVLLYGFHNLYYVDFPFIDASWVKKGDKFTYIATQRTIPPKTRSQRAHV